MNQTEFNQLKARVDVSQIFLVVMSLVGDLDRAAAALDLDPDFVKQLAEQEGWIEKLRRVSLMSKGGKPGDYERAQNRAMNFVMAHQLRTQVERLLRVVTELDDMELMDRCSTRTKDGGKQVSARFLLEIANASEACARQTYAALADTAGEREIASGDKGAAATGDLHSAIVAALSNPAASVPSSTLLLAETNSTLNAITERKSSEPSGESKA